MVRVLISGLLLIANLFLFGAYGRFSENIVQPHLLSPIAYQHDQFIFQAYLYVTPLVYLICFLIKPDFWITKKLNLWYFYLIVEVGKVIDFFLYYNWNLVDVNIVGGFMIGITFLYMAIYLMRSVHSPRK